MITSPQNGIYLLHNPIKLKKFLCLKEAKKQAKIDAKKIVKEKCLEAGAKNIKITLRQADKIVKINHNEDLFIESTIIAIGSGSASKK